jgi:hypothetical protein
MNYFVKLSMYIDIAFNFCLDIQSTMFDVYAQITITMMSQT